MTGGPHSPPRVAIWLLERVLASHLRDAILGDLAERHGAEDEDAKRRGRDRARAGRRYWLELLHAPRTWFVPASRPTPNPQPPRRRGDHTVTLLLSDIRYAWRTMMRRKGFTIVAAGTLALGIGASTAIFSAVHPILVRTLPYPEPGQLTMVWEREPGGEKSNIGFATFDDIERHNRSFEAVAAMGGAGATLSVAGRPMHLDGQRVTPDFFRVLGVAPAIGRDFTSDDNVRGTPNVLILSHALWRDAFGGDRGILEQPVTLNGVSYSVVGVMPEGFDNVLAPAARFWAPLRYNVTLPWACRTCRHLRMIARRSADVSAEAAAREIDVLAQNAFRDHPTEYTGAGMMTTPLSRDLTENVRPALLALLGAVLVVLLVASLNVSNLLLARGASRRGEFAMRVALGADRGRIMRQLLTESVVLALVGGVAGVALALVGVKWLVALSPPELPRLSAISVNGTVLAFAFLLTTSVGIVFGFIPAWQASKANVHEGIRRAARSVVGSDGIARGTVVVSEVALALVLLVGSGLLMRSMRELLAVSPGFEPSGLLTMQIHAGAGRLSNDTLVRAFYDEALASVRQLPRVTGAALTSQLPLSGDFDGYGVHLQSRPAANPSDDPSGFRYAVSDGYFETMGIPLARGRLFTARDDERAVPVAIINAAFAARHFFQGLEPIGERVRIGGSDSGPWREIVGIVGDVKQLSLETGEPDAIYLPASQWEYSDASRSMVVRTAGEPAALAPAVRNAIWSVDADQPIVRVATADALVAATAAERRFALVLFEAFALVALVLAAAGIYGVLIGNVTDRTRELGVRAAFGASTRDLIWMVVRHGMALTAVGVIAGLGLAMAATRAMTGMLFGISVLDPVTYAAMTATLLVVALVACWVPAFRASRIHPLDALRQE